MDKSWINKPRYTDEYEQGVRDFIDFAFKNSSINGEAICPCKHCSFKKWKSKDEMLDHLICSQFPTGYTHWFYHGESDMGEPSNISTSDSPNTNQNNIIIENSIQNMINDAFGVDRYKINEQSAPSTNYDSSINEQYVPSSNDNGSMQERVRSNASQGTVHDKEFYELTKDVEQPLFEGCTKYSKLSFLLKLYHIKCLCRMSDKAMTMILELLHDAFDNAKIPSSFYDAKKIINKLGLDYKKIVACPNDCMLYWGSQEDEERETCKVCNTSKWKPMGDKRRQKKIPAKVLRYFPLKPRLQRLFISSKSANDMIWHATDNNNDGMMRHPRDSEAWKNFNAKHTLFASDPRNVRLALATDGFNPFGTLSSSYSIWPVVLIPYNTPPWVCMKQTSFIMSMIIPGKKSPGNDLDVYLQPLINELKELWVEGVDTYDANKKEMFKLHAALMWTISDFPGLCMLSGWNTYTGLACPSCNFDSTPLRLPHSKKWCFMCHRRFLKEGHKLRLNRIRFNGEQELRSPPKSLSGIQIFEQVASINVTFGKNPETDKKGKRNRDRVTPTVTQQWKKMSIFFQLPYWKHNMIRHNLDVMHIEKNVCDNIIFTLLNDSAKSKDHLNARKDLKAMGFKQDLWPDENGKYPLAIYTLSNAGKKTFLTTLKNITVPDGYSSNISRCIDLDHLKLNGMLKSHDCHILMEQLLPLAMRKALPYEVSAILIELCSFFRQLCNKVLDTDELDVLQSKVILTLCHMEILFPPSFFTVMVHLVVHLVEEAKQGGPVHYRWMYPMER